MPLIWGIDAVHGNSNIVGATLFPHNVGLGAMRDAALVEKIGRATAREIRVTGQEWTFAPTVTVPQDWRWGRAYEGYSSDPALVASYVGAMVRGLQGAPDGYHLLEGPYVLASTKHFLADGGTKDGVDQGDAPIGEVELRDIHGLPYGPAIENGVATVMTSFSSWQGVKMAGNRSLVTDILKGRMDFEGFVVTDWNAHGQVAGCTNEACPQALEAGIDMYMAPDTWKPVYNDLLARAKAGTLPMARVDDAVRRILGVKMRLGLFEAGKPSARPYSGQWNLLGAPEHRAIAREAVRKSLVLLKNQGVLPLMAGGRLLVAGEGADDIARQSGGWTLSWQGTGLDNSLFPGATSLFAGLRQAVEAGGGSAQLSPDGSFAARPDAAVVVFGEKPLCRVPGRPRHAGARCRPHRSFRDHAQAEGAGHSGGRGDAHRPPALRERRAQRRRCLRGRLAAGERRRRAGGCSGGRPSRRAALRLHRQAAHRLATHREHGRRGAVRFRLRPQLCLAPRRLVPPARAGRRGARPRFAAVVQRRQPGVALVAAGYWRRRGGFHPRHHSAGTGRRRAGARHSRELSRPGRRPPLSRSPAGRRA